MVRFLRAIASWISHKRWERDVRLAVAKADLRTDHRGSFDLFGWILAALAVWGAGVGLGVWDFPSSVNQPVSQAVLYSTEYSIAYAAPNYRHNIRQTFWEVEHEGSAPERFEGSYTFEPQGTYWGNGVFGPYTSEMTVAAGILGGGACDAVSFVAEALGEAGLEVSGKSHIAYNHYAVPGLKNPQKYSIVVVTAGSWRDHSKPNGTDFKIYNPFPYPVTLHWKVKGDSISLWVTGEGGGKVLPPKLGWLVAVFALLVLLWRGCGRVLGLLLPAMFLAGWVVAVTFAAQAGILDKEIPVGAVINWPPKIEWPTISSEVRLWVSGDHGPELIGTTLPEFNIQYWNGQVVHFYVDPEVWKAAVAAQKKYPYCDPRLSIAVAFSESPRYNNTVLSPVGAAGTWQFMPGTWNTWSPDPSAPRTDVKVAAEAFCRYAKEVGMFDADSEQEFVQAFAHQTPVWNQHEGQARLVWRLWQELKRRMPR